MNANANIAARLTETARQLAKQHAIVSPPRKLDFFSRINRAFNGVDIFGRDQPRKALWLNFEQLDIFIHQIARGLKCYHILPPMRTIVMVPPGINFVAYSFALFRLGAVPVLIDPGMGMRNLGTCIGDASPGAFIGSSLAHWARRLFGWGSSSIRIKLQVNELGTWALNDDCEFVLDYAIEADDVDVCQRQDSDLAAILFTSGSTGPAKGAVYTHGMFQEQVRVMREVFGIEPGEVDLCTFPLFALFAPTLGMTSIVPDMDPTRPAKADPKKLIKAIFDYQVTNLFGSPALIDVLSRYGEKHDIRLPTLRRVISAGAPAPAAVIERMAKMLNPGVQVFTPYGATECLPIAVIGSDEILGETRHKTDQGAGICVGRPVGRIEVRIIPIDDGPILTPPHPPLLRGGEIGEITVRGQVVSQSYWNLPDADALHKIPDGDTVWHRTGDIGYFDDIGRLWFCGRKAHRVILPEQTLFTIPVEGVFNVHPDVFRTALVGAVKNGVKRPVLCVELEKQCRRKPRDIVPELEAIRDRFPHIAAIRDFLFHSGFPVDIRHNAKINREKLALWAARRLR